MNKQDLLNEINKYEKLYENNQDKMIELQEKIEELKQENVNIMKNIRENFDKIRELKEETK